MAKVWQDNIYKYFKNIYGQKQVSLDFWLKKVCEIRNYLLKEIKYNDLMNEKTKKCIGF